MDMCRDSAAPTRRDLLKLGATAVAAGGVIAVTNLAAPGPAVAQTPKRGGVLRLAHQLDPVGLDPHQTISFATLIPLSFIYSRLMKVKAGPLVKPGTYPVETDLAESWTQPSDTTYVFKLRKGVRWHPKPPANGRELTAEDVKYTYERFLTIKGNGNKPVLEMVDRIEAVDRYTVKFSLSEPFAWFVDALAATSTWIIAREAVEKFGDLKKAEAAIGTGPFMLERHEPNVRMTFVRHPDYFVAAGCRESTTSGRNTSRSSGAPISTSPGRASPASGRRSTSGSRAATRLSNWTRSPSRMFACAGPWGARATGGSSSSRARTPSGRAPPTWRCPRPRRSGPFRSAS